jgi:sodium/proline symporter
MVLLSFLFFLLSFVAIGIFSTLKSKKTASDYLMASHSAKPWMIALAAVATNNSGYMFVGMIGYAYISGISVFWIMIMALIGDFCASIFVHKKLRIVSGKMHALSFSEAISKWGGEEYKLVRKVSALIVVIFLSIYAAAQLKAGGKAMNVLFGFDAAIGSIIGGAIVLFYCSSGGIRASIWTNTAQSFVMIACMAVLFFSAIAEIGGFSQFISALKNVSPNYFSLYPSELLFGQNIGLALFLIGWFFGGFGIVGQVHVMTSFMAMSSPENIKKIRVYYYSWYFFFFALTIGTGLAARLLIPFDGIFDPELALPTLAKNILPELLIGLILAGLFSSTMSTADSQILSCSAAITNDLLHKKNNGYRTAKISTIFITIAATIVAVMDNQSVFSLVMIAWLALACSFSQVIIIYSLGGKMSQKLVLTMMLTGFVTMMIWRSLGLGNSVYEAAPGILAGLIPYFLAKKINFSFGKKS